MEGYEVFISFKNTDSSGQATRDVAMAEELYRTLKQRGIRTFFSKYSVDESARSDYVDAIDEALESALLLVAVGTSRKNMTSKWVKTEINQFRALMNKDEDGKRSIISYRSEDFPPDELPSGLQPYQSFGDLDPLVRFIETFFKKDSGFQNNGEQTELLYDGSGQSADAILKRGSQPLLQVGSLLDGRYKILSLLGKGGMSCVYLAVDIHTQKQYAIKELHTNTQIQFDIGLKGFLDEASLLQQLDHPSIPKVYDIIHMVDSFILVMDFIKGESLNKVLSQHGPMQEAQALKITRQLGQVLDYLHTRPAPIIYRDLKPSNVIWEPGGNVKLIDFGAARKYNPIASDDTTCLGTVGYAAPEQFGGMGQTDPRTDIYTLGVTLYQLVTDKNPAEPPYEILPIRQINPDLSQGLELIIQKCIQRDPTQRFQSAKELLTALDQIHELDPQTLFPSGFRTTAANQIGTRRRPQMPPPQSPRPESLMDTAVLSPELEQYTPHYAPPAPPVFSAPLARPVSMPVMEPYPVSPVPAPKKPKTKKVSVRSKATASSDRELETAIAKLTDLDPDSRRLVCELIERLSK